MIDLMTTSKRYLTVPEVMEIFQVSRRTVYYWVEDRQVEFIAISNTVRISVAYLRSKVHTVDPSRTTPSFSRSVQRITTHQLSA